MDIEENDTLMENLASAWDAVETENSEDGQEHEQEASIEAQEAALPEQEEAVETEQDDEPLQAEGEKPPAEPKQASDLETPPAGLPPEAREVWKDVPASVKAAIAKREEDYSRGIQMYANNAKRAEQMDKTLAPYQQLFAMNGGPQNTIPGLLQTASILQMGAPAQKADLMANMIKQFGIDVRALDNALVGQKPPAEMQRQSEMDRMFNERLTPIQEKLKSYEQREQEAERQRKEELQSQISQFSQGKEFYADVRADMADLMDMAANRGREMSLQEAYDTACRAHPQISKIIGSRSTSQQVGRKRAAASSIHGGPGGSMSADHSSLAATLSEAWDNAGRV